MSKWIHKNNWRDMEELIEESKGVAIIPVGSTEQHGYHLPLGTDTYVAITLAEAAAKETKVVLAPPIWFGWSPHHMVLPGTITIRPEVLIEYLYDVIESLTQHGINKYILINGHRIVNIIWMQLAAERAQRKLGIKVKIFDPAYMSKDIVKELGFGPVGHAEEIETSHMLYCYSELVNMEKAEDNPIKPVDLYSVDPSYPNDTLCYVPSTIEVAKEHAEKAGGTTGEPTKASKEKGKIYHEHLVKNLVKIIKDLQQEN
ncbi:Creatininase [[Clostridium] ultunense Esp]|uniref:Creatininase n=1 Tax=[Clostridium] ultunense Esp TaxID=1288971 RepID=M1ZC01_9FIRM|nr:creatininase family protein [Schnuerera ultunensis]CCQ95323.1 Creatininase [[Clostridium] ultunense Esp]SHD76284.1 Creatininase [[Clostridium] ultunense Esp]